MIQLFRAAPLVRVKAKFTVKNAVCCRQRLLAYGVLDCEFDFDSQSGFALSERKCSFVTSLAEELSWLNESEETGNQHKGRQKWARNSWAEGPNERNITCVVHEESFVFTSNDVAGCVAQTLQKLYSMMVLAGHISLLSITLPQKLTFGRAGRPWGRPDTRGEASRTVCTRRSETPVCGRAPASPSSCSSCNRMDGG